MADFRKWFLAFAVLALVAGSVYAQGLQCVATGGVPPILRAEGLTEQVGDVLLNCTGGTPTAPGAPIPRVNVQVFLSTPITSRLVGGSSSNVSAAMLLIDEPQPGTNPVPGRPTQVLCGDTTGAAGSCVVNGVGATANPAGNAYAGPYTSFNVWQGVYNPPTTAQNVYNSIVFLGVPFDAPGTLGGIRTMRITNIRTAPGSPSSSLIPQPIVEYISITGATSVPINNPQQIVGYSQNGLTQGSVVKNTADQPFSICTGQNALNDSGNGLHSDVTKAAGSQLYLTATEGFASSFKVRNVGQVGAADPVNAPNAPQDIPGGAYNTETGFYAPNLTGGTGVSKAGIATQGTRLRFTLNNIPTGATAYVPTVVPIFAQGNIGAAGGVTGAAVLVSTNAAGAGTGSSGVVPIVTSGTISASAGQIYGTFGDEATGIGTAVSGLTGVATPALVAVSSGGAVVYEVVATNPFGLEQLAVPVVVSFGSGFSSDVQVATTATANVTFAPVSTETAANALPSATAPIPRFMNMGPSGNIFSFNPCFCNILFPYVTTQQGYETGIAISNTSADPFGTGGSTGTVTINYYGMNAPTPAAGNSGFTSTATVAPGGQMVFTVGGGNGSIISPTAGTSPTANEGLPAVANFQGYIIAQARFQYCHGFAFITCAGCGATAPGASESYLGLILDKAAAPRATGNSSETLGN